MKIILVKENIKFDINKKIFVMKLT